jgi:hypothetical protein
VATEGIVGMYVETRNYGATAAFWASMGYTSEYESADGWGHWTHPSGGPYVFISEQHDRDLAMHPVLGVADAAAFQPRRAPDFVAPFTAQHWGVVEAVVRDPDGRTVSLQAPLSESGSSHG